MHEIAITKEIIRILEEECLKNKIIPKKIKLELGSITNFKEDPIRHYFEILTKGHSHLSNSQLDIVNVQGKVRCKDCKKETLIEDPYIVLCQECESFNVDIIEGRDLKVLELVSDNNV